MAAKSHFSWRKFLIRTSIVILTLIVILILVASPVAKYLVEKYDVDYTGREITIGRAFVNPVTGSISLRNFEMYEQNSDTVFASIGRFATNIGILKILTGVYDVSSLKINNPSIRVVRNDTVFNFTDLIEKFTVVEDTAIEDKGLKLNIRNIRVTSGTVRYSEKEIPVDLTFSEFNFRSDGLRWDVDSINGNFSLIPGEGNLEGNFMFNQENKRYRLALNLTDLGIKQFEPYLDAMAGDANVSAYINLNLNTSGNADSLMNGRASGSFELRDFHFGPNAENDYFSLRRFLVQFREIDLHENKFYFDSILIDRPDIVYQMYDSLDNYRRMFRSTLAKEAEEEVEQAADTVDLLVDLIGSDYYIRNLAVQEARLEFEDYSIAEKFTIAIDPLNVTSDSIDKQNKRVKVIFNGRLQPYGRFAATLSMNPKDEENFDFAYEFRDISAPVFNPYIATFTSYQLDRGTIEMHGEWHVNNSLINSLNHFLVIDPQDTKRVRGKDTKWIPLPLIMSFVRERGSVIDYQIPVKGDLNDPKFKIWDIISDVLRNILVKPPTTPYRLEVKNIENKIEKIMRVTWKMRQYRIEEGQEKFMKNISEFLKKNPEAHLVIQPVFHVAKEKENILMFEAKKKYFFLSQDEKVGPLSKDDSMRVEKLSSKDSSFIRFMDRSLKDSELLTLQEKCSRFVGSVVVERSYDNLIKFRREAFLQQFVNDGTAERIEFKEIQNKIPYTWFSYYEINYKGDIPETLAEAFDKLYEINSEPPRREFFDPPARR